MSKFVRVRKHEISASVISTAREAMWCMFGTLSEYGEFTNFEFLEIHAAFFILALRLFF